MAVVDGVVGVNVRKIEGRPGEDGPKASWRSLVARLGIRTALIVVGSIPLIVVSGTVLEGRISLMTA
jgi:hypothetical protein